MNSRKITALLIVACALLVVAGAKVSQLTRTVSLQTTSRFLVSTQDATSGRWDSRYIRTQDLATNLWPFFTNTGGGLPSYAITNNQTTEVTLGNDLRVGVNVFASGTVLAQDFYSSNNLNTVGDIFSGNDINAVGIVSGNAVNANTVLASSNRIRAAHFTGGQPTNSFLYVGAGTNLAAGTFGSGLAFAGGTLTTAPTAPTTLTNLQSIHWLVEQRLIATNSSSSNIVVNFAATNTIELYATNNLTFTNWTGLTDQGSSSVMMLIRPQLVNRGVNWGNVGLSNPGFSVAIATNATNPLWTTLSNGMTYSLSITRSSTNLFPLIALWQ